MDYTGISCPGCGRPFTDSDDIVVCPECGTPQHRECYEKQDRCVNSDKHAEGYIWQSGVRKAPPTETKTQTVTCPNCGAPNPKGSETCGNCGMKFTLFGMNVVDAIHENENNPENPDGSIPDYRAPFTLGEGEGFDREEGRRQAAAADFMKDVFSGMLSDNLQNNPGDGSNEDKRLKFEGPFPDSDEIDGVRTNTVGTFVGQNGLSYISKFKKMQSGKSLSFNFAALFLAPYWFFFRKLYKVGILFMTVSLALSILAVPASLQYLEFMENLVLELPDTATVTDEQFAAFAAEVSAEMMNAMKPLLLFFAANLLLHLVAGFSANHIYKKYVILHASNAEKLPEKKLAMTYVVKYGGASLFAALGAFFAQELISMLISNLL